MTDALEILTQLIGVFNSDIQDRKRHTVPPTGSSYIPPPS